MLRHQRALTKIIGKHENKVSILDLFFDITLIVFIGGISHELINHLAGDQDWRLISTEILELFTIFFIWRVYMLFAIVAWQGIRYRILTMVVMAAMFLMGLATFFSVETKESFLINVIGFCVAMSALIMFIWGFKEKYHKEHKDSKRIGWIVSSFIISIFISLSSLIVNYCSQTEHIKEYIIIGLWIANMAQLYLTDIISSKKDYVYDKKTTEMIEERYNVLFVLFSGEGLISIISVFAFAHKGLPLVDNSFGYLVLSFFLIFGWWWLFNDYVTYTKLKSTNRSVTAFSYLMLPFLFGITLMFVGIALMVEKHTQIGVLTFAIAHTIIGITFVFLIRLQENFLRERFYIREVIWEKIITVVAITASIVQVIIAVYVDIPWLILGLNGFFVVASVVAGYIEFLKTSAVYIDNPELFEKHILERNPKYNSSKDA